MITDRERVTFLNSCNDRQRETIQKLDAEITRLREADRWIPCSERMPDEETVVEVVARRPISIWNTNEECYVTLADYCPSSRHVCAFWRSPFSGAAIAVTHWRPLPPSPLGNNEAMEE